jgi:hypothetical protein
MAFLNQHQLIEIRTNSDQKAEQHLSHVYGATLGASFIPCMRPRLGYWSGGYQRTSFEHKRACTGRLAPPGQHSWRTYSQRGPLVSAYLSIKRSVGI